MSRVSGMTACWMIRGRPHVVFVAAWGLLLEDPGRGPGMTVMVGIAYVGRELSDF